MLFFMFILLQMSSIQPLPSSTSPGAEVKRGDEQELACLDPPSYSLLSFPWLPQQGLTGLLLPSDRRQEYPPLELGMHSHGSLMVAAGAPQLLDPTVSPALNLTPGSHLAQGTESSCSTSLHNTALAPISPWHFPIREIRCWHQSGHGMPTAHLSCTRPGAAGLQADAPRICSILHHQLLMLATSW